jgi:hypothetical protein
MTMEPRQSYSPSGAARERYRCPLCGRDIAAPHFKRHLWTHDREGRGNESNVAWLDFLTRRQRAGAK